MICRGSTWPRAATEPIKPNADTVANVIAPSFKPRRLLESFITTIPSLGTFSVRVRVSRTPLISTLSGKPTIRNQTGRKRRSGIRSPPTRALRTLSIVPVQCTFVDMPSSRTTQRLSMVISAATTALQLRYGAMHEKFAASLVLPVPLYFATCGYGHSGRVMITRLFST